MVIRIQGLGVLTTRFLSCRLNHFVIEGVLILYAIDCHIMLIEFNKIYNNILLLQNFRLVFIDMCCRCKLYGMAVGSFICLLLKDML